MLKKSLGLVSGAALICIFAYGCSSSTDTVAGAGADSGGATDAKASVKETGTTVVDDAAATSCAPDPAIGKDFAPTWKAPTGKGLKKCTDDQVDALIACNYEQGTQTAACKTTLAAAANKDCLGCLFTLSTAAKYGPIIERDGYSSLNKAGCIALLEPDVTDKGCGAKLQALSDCGTEVCAGCPVTDDASLAEFQKCVTKSSSTVCKAFNADAACATDLIAAGAAAELCDSGTTFEEAAAIYGKLFCSGATSDGGTDAADAHTDG